jgi:hypothetical protein
VLAAALTVATCSFAQAVVIEFTGSEGYTNGDLWSQSPSSGYSWNTISDFTVNTGGGGSVTTSPSAGSNSFPARYSQGFSSAAGQTLSLSMDFTFLGVNVTTAPGSAGDRQYISNLNFGGSPTGIFDGVIGGNITTLEFAPSGVYSFQVFSNEYATFLPSAVGLTTTGGTTSDDLRLTLTTTIAPSGSTSYTMELYNLDTNSLVVSVTGSADLSSYSNLYAAFSGGGSPVTGTQFTTTRLEIQSVPEPTAGLLAGLGIALVCGRRRLVARR